MSGISIEIPGLEGRFDKICMVYGRTGISTMRLHEISESEAPGDIAVIYADMRRCMRLPLVNLIYRHLATMPDVLPWVWGAVRPAVLSGELDAALDRLKRDLPLPELAPFDRTMLATLDGADRFAIGRVLDAYNRGNGLNLIALTALCLALHRPEAAGRGATLPGESPSRAIPALPPLLKLGDLDAETAKRVRDIALLHGGGPRAVPSLYLHLAHWPRFLAAICDRIRPHLDDGSLGRTREVAVELARDAAERLLSSLASASPPPAQHFDQITTVLDHFTRRVIPEMLPVGLAIDKALPHLRGS